MLLNRYIVAPLVVAVAAVMLVSAGAYAQVPSGSPGMDDKRMQEFSEVMGKLRTTSLLLSLERSMEKQRDRVDAKGDSFNPVLAASSHNPNRSSLGSAEVEPPEEVSECINPPARKRARYVVAYLDVAPRIDRMRGIATGFELDEQKLTEAVAERYMPDKFADEQPGVSVVVNLGENEWAYHLDEAWPEADSARQWIESSVGADVDHKNAACEVADAVEALLDQAASSSVSEALQHRQLRERLRSIRSDFDDLRSDIESGNTDTVVFRERVRPALNEADQQLERATDALEAGDFTATRKALKRADEYSSRADSDYMAWLSLEIASRKARSQLDGHFDETELRRVSWLPYGDDLDRKLRACEEEVSQFGSLVGDGAPMDDTSDQRVQAQECLDQFSNLRSSTRSRFDLVVVYAPTGLVSVLCLILVIGLGRRRGRYQTLNYELMPMLSEWEQRVSMLERRLERLEREYDWLLEGGEASALDKGLTREDVDTIDRAFALGARARDILDEAEQLQSDASTLTPGPLRDALELLTEASSEPTQSTSDEVTPIRPGLLERETIEHHRILDLADELTRRADAILSELDSADSNSQQAW